MARRPSRHDCWLRGIRGPFHMGYRPREADPAGRSATGTGRPRLRSDTARLTALSGTVSGQRQRAERWHSRCSRR
jgi:hypothetical protein